MKAALKFLLAMLIGIELAFFRSIYLNSAVILLSLLYLFWKKVAFKRLLWLFIVGMIPFIGSWFMYYSMTADHSQSFAWIMASRVYSYIYLGGIIVFSQSTTDLMRSFEQDLHMNPTFVYGILGALNFMPKMIQQIKIIKASAKMRGVRLTIFSPQLYVKAIYNSFVWSDNLSQAMYAHGFIEGQKRSHYQKHPLEIKEIVLFFLILVLGLLLALIK